MIEMIRNLLSKYKSLIMYAIFGLLTTVVNILTYQLCYSVLKIPNVISTVIAWILAVGVAFVTNKKWVFDSPSFDRKTLAREIPRFISARLLTGVLDVIIMYVSVDILKWNATLWKIIDNVIVIVVNYVASKLVVFMKAEDK